MFCYNQSVKKILAVSGGIDSMVLLEKFVRAEPENIVVAHFNHGTRVSADLDERFVFYRCQELGVPFETRKILLGEGASEELARQKRYDFLYHVANKYDGEIYTAHHLDDLIESIAINLIRGTGWRGLTPFSDNQIRRPFIEMGFYKTNILRFAAENEVLFREDPTNSTDDYLRNRVRTRLLNVPRVEKEKLVELYKKQTVVRREIEEICELIFNSLLMKNSSGEINKEVDYLSEVYTKNRTLKNFRIRKDFFMNKNGSPERKMNGMNFEKTTVNLGIDSELKSEVSSELDSKVDSELDSEKAIEEILRKVCEKFGISLTRVQLKDFLRAIRTYGTNKKFNLPKDKMAVIGRDFIEF